MIKLKISGINEFPFYGIYRYMSFFILPVILLFFILEKPLEIDISPLYKALLIYIFIMLILLSIFARIKSFENYFITAHYIFLGGVMGINFFWFWYDPQKYDTDVLIVAFNLIGLAMIKPWATAIFYFTSVLIYLLIAFDSNNININMTFLLISCAVVISLFNTWRNNLLKDLNVARETYKTMFDNTKLQTYVLDSNLNILDFSYSAESYLNENGVTKIKEKSLMDVLIPSSNKCEIALKEAMIACDEKGSAEFQMNCAVGPKGAYLPKEMSIRKSQYFKQEAYLLSVRIVAAEKESQRELLEHKDNVTQILENINYFFFNISFDENERSKHQVNFVSAKVKEVYGYTVDEYISLIKAENIDKDRHPEDKGLINTKFEKLLKNGGKDSWRFRMKVNDEWRWIEEKIFVEKAENEPFISLFGMVKDITEEIHAEQLVKDSERRYKQIFETNLAGVYKTNIKGELLDCNQAFADLLGYTVEELKTNRIQQIYFDEKDRKEYIVELKAKKQLNNYQLKLKRKDGRKLIVTNNVSIQTNQEDEEESIIGTLIDLTDLHETSLALQLSEEKYRLLFEESNNAILLVVLSDEGNIIADVNQMATQLFEFTENELLGMKVLELIPNEDDYTSDMKKVVKSLNKGDRAEMEWEFKRKDGNHFYAEVSFASVMMGQENVAQLIIKDISDRKQYEKEILESRLSFKNIVDRSPASILIFSEKGELEYVNPNGEDLFINVLSSKDRNMYRVFPEEKHQLIKDLIAEAENQINSYTEIDLGQGENVKRYSINIVNTTYNFEKANLFILQDITLQTEYNIQKLRAEMAEETNVNLQEEINRHERTQRSLLESTSRLNALFESTGHLFMLTIDKEFNIVAQNQNFKTLVVENLKIDVEPGMNFMEIFPIEDHAYERIVDRFNSVFEGKASDLISNFKTAKGDVVWMESFISPIIIDEQQINEISFISHDITEQVENRKRILESEENNRAILLTIPDILFKANREGYFTDYRATSEENRIAFKRFSKTESIKGRKIEDVISDQNVAKEITEHVNMALTKDKVLTHNFSVSTEVESGDKVHFENRYSKVNDDEVVIISRDVTSTVEYEEKLIESVKEKEVLLKEVHHRVKNNLQVINSILNLQSSYVKDEETLQIIIESQNRIRSMSYIHESLYQTKDFSSINFKDYITNLVQNLVHSYEVYSDKTKLDLKIDGVDLALDQAIPCGLILNELITNALKYAFPDDQGGKITIEVKESKGKIHMKVQDFGVGLPKDFNISETDSLGLSLVDTLIDQLDGELQLKTKGGTEFLIIFDKQEF